MIDYTRPLDQLPDPLPIEPLRAPFDVTITPPGSKSITNRAYILAALARGESKIIRPLRSDDCDMLLDALCTLGAQARWEGEDVYITGVNGRFPRGGEVNLGHGGTPARFMIAAACLAAEPVVIDGSKRMRERPIAEGVDMLRQLGAHIEYVEEEGRLPVRVTPSDEFKGGTLAVGKTASSQFVSAILLVGMCLNHIGITFDRPPTSEHYIAMTIAMMTDWGARDEWAHHRWERIVPPMRWERKGYSFSRRPLSAREFVVEPDASSCAYWVAAATVANSSTSHVPMNFDGKQPDTAILAYLKRMGVHIMPSDNMTAVRRPSTVVPIDSVDCGDWPDGSMAAAVVAATLPFASHFTGLHTLRVKETDRIAALQTELTKCGCKVEATDDSITITPLERDSDGNIARTDPVTIETYDDHRMAMAFAILGLVRPGISIADPAVVSKSYPTFWADFAKLYHNQPTTD